MNAREHSVITIADFVLLLVCIRIVLHVEVVSWLRCLTSLEHLNCFFNLHHVSHLRIDIKQISIMYGLRSITASSSHNLRDVSVMQRNDLMDPPWA